MGADEDGVGCMKAMKVDDQLNCGLCLRAFARARLTKHHCLPKQKGGAVDDVALICSQCHGMVHATYTNETLARCYPTIESLRDAPELTKFLVWVRKQPATRKKRNKPRKRRL
jgi:5-methylcytosine-specific restriction protein A